MLSSVEQAFVGREEIRAPLKTPAWEATVFTVTTSNCKFKMARFYDLIFTLGER